MGLLSAVVIPFVGAPQDVGVWSPWGDGVNSHLRGSLWSHMLGKQAVSTVSSVTVKPRTWDQVKDSFCVTADNLCSLSVSHL